MLGALFAWCCFPPSLSHVQEKEKFETLKLNHLSVSYCITQVFFLHEPQGYPFDKITIVTMKLMTIFMARAIMHLSLGVIKKCLAERPVVDLLNSHDIKVDYYSNKICFLAYRSFKVIKPLLV